MTRFEAPYNAKESCLPTRSHSSFLPVDRLPLGLLGILDSCRPPDCSIRHVDDDLADEIPALEEPIRLAMLREGEDLSDDRLDLRHRHRREQGFKTGPGTNRDARDRQASREDVDWRQPAAEAAHEADHANLAADPGRCRGFDDGRLSGDTDDLVHALAVGEVENLAAPIG